MDNLLRVWGTVLLACNVTALKCKSEAPNTKRIQVTEIQMTETGDSQAVGNGQNFLATGFCH